MQRRGCGEWKCQSQHSRAKAGHGRGVRSCVGDGTEKLAGPRNGSGGPLGKGRQQDGVRRHQKTRHFGSGGHAIGKNQTRMLMPGEHLTGEARGLGLITVDKFKTRDGKSWHHGDGKLGALNLPSQSPVVIAQNKNQLSS